MGTILIIILLIIIFGGGGGYYAHGRYGTAGLGGVLGIVLIVLIVLWLVGGIGAYGPRIRDARRRGVQGSCRLDAVSLVFDELATKGLQMRAQPELGRSSSAALLASSSPAQNVPSTAPSCAAGPRAVAWESWLMLIEAGYDIAFRMSGSDADAPSAQRPSHS